MTRSEIRSGNYVRFPRRAAETTLALAALTAAAGAPGCSRREHVTTPPTVAAAAAPTAAAVAPVAPASLPSLPAVPSVPVVAPLPALVPAAAAAAAGDASAAPVDPTAAPVDPAAAAGAAPGPEVPTRVMLMRVPEMPFEQFRANVLSPSGIRLCHTTPLDYGTDQDITRHMTCRSFAAAQIDEALYLRTIRPAFGSFHGGEALQPPNCQMRNDHEQVCSANHNGPYGTRWVVDRTGGQHRVIEVTDWSMNDG